MGDLSVLDGTIVAVTWLSEWIRDDVLRDGYAEVEHLAEWSEWVPMPTASAPRLPGVYLLREPDTHLIRHVGLAGERAGGGRTGPYRLRPHRRRARHRTADGERGC